MAYIIKGMDYKIDQLKRPSWSHWPSTRKEVRKRRKLIATVCQRIEAV
jgi:hypothetical protein